MKKTMLLADFACHFENLGIRIQTKKACRICMSTKEIQLIFSFGMVIYYFLSKTQISYIQQIKNNLTAFDQSRIAQNLLHFKALQS
jgi:hypothetical protein